MREIETSDLKQEMIIAKDVFSEKGQLIVAADSCLTRQMISHLLYYKINSVFIIDDDNIPLATKESMQKKSEIEKSHIAKLISTAEFNNFKKLYQENTKLLENSFNDIILKNTPIDQPSLIDDTVRLYEQNAMTYSLFGMLHSMKEIDDSTYAHCINVSIISRLIGTWMDMSAKALDDLTHAGLLHDIGKCQIPNDILLKPGKLTPQEYEFMKKHPEFGYSIVKNQDIDENIKKAVLLHHERFDGTGYPYGWTGDKLDDFSSIVCIADVYDAMTSVRCYRGALCPFDVIANFEQEGLGKYNPKFIYSFLKRIANSYINCEVLLSNDEVARIIYITKKLTRPVVQLNKDGSFLSLEEHPDIYIEAIV